MKMKSKTIFLLIIFILLSTFLYPMVLGNWAAITIPALSSLTKNRILHLTIVALNSAIGGLICASILAFPLGYLTRQKPMIVGIALGIVGAGINLYRFPMEFNWYVGTVQLAEYSSFVLGAALFTWCGCRVGLRRITNG
jgi:hypothetical protein